jgi:hypothetical protein
MSLNIKGLDSIQNAMLKKLENLENLEKTKREEYGHLDLKTL